MSHSQFHCTGRAYLDMHGLIFETSICYWQDQPGRGKREHTEPGVPGRGRRGGGRRRWRRRRGGAGAAPTRTPRAGKGRGGGEHRGPTDSPPRPRRGRPTAYARDHEGSRRAAATSRRGGTREGGKGARAAPPPGLSPHLRPPTPPPKQRGPQPRRPGSGAAGTGRSLRRPAGACPLTRAHSVSYTHLTLPTSLRV